MLELEEDPKSSPLLDTKIIGNDMGFQSLPFIRFLLVKPKDLYILNLKYNRRRKEPSGMTMFLNFKKCSHFT